MMITNDIQKTLKLFRLYDEQHAVLVAPIKYRQAYYAALKLFTSPVSKISGYTKLFEDIKTLFDLPVGCSEELTDKDYKSLHKRYIKRQKGFFGIFKKPIYEYKYSYLLIIESAAFLNMADGFNAENYMTETNHIFPLTEKEQKWFKKYFDLLTAKDYTRLVQRAETPDIRYMKASTEHFTQLIAAGMKYETLPVFNIAVVATMSAGKSTFINALLGNEIFPESQAACTAKITSIYDNDCYNRVAGVVLRNNELKNLSNKLDNNQLIEWNRCKDFDRIILEGNLDNITNSKKIVAVHDTPGTNFSGDETHHDITFDFLENNKMDAIIYIANAEHLATTDECCLLTELYEKIIKNKKIQAIFIVNKADAMDPEKENLFTHCQVLRDEIISIGFSPESSIIPVSAKYARLFKMVLADRAASLTEKETRNLITGVSMFEENKVSDSENIYGDVQRGDTSVVSIGNKMFTRRELKQALCNTGFTNVESVLAKIAKNI